MRAQTAVCVLRHHIAALGLLLPLAGQCADEEAGIYRGLICRGVEESGRLTIGQPGFGPHLVSLFVTGPNPLSATQTLAEHVAWANDPRHSYVADGTGSLVIWAHPHGVKAADMLRLPGLAGMEVHYAGDCAKLDKLWDEVLTGCHGAGRPFLWGYAADDTHSRTSINLSWFSARIAAFDEASLKTALRSGSFYVSNGPEIDDIAVEGRTIRIALPQQAEVLWLRAGQYLGARPTDAMVVSPDPGENRCTRQDQGVSNSGLSLDELAIPSGEFKYVRAVVRTDPDKIALTQPFRVHPDGSIDNPYATGGQWVRGQTHNHTDSGYGKSNLPAFRLAYQEQGQLASFSTDYSYWESPYQWLPTDGTPHIMSVTPNRSAEGQDAEVTITGVNFGDSPEVRVGTLAAAVVEGSTQQVRIKLPSALAPGVYDVTVDNARGFRGCLAQGFTVQDREARNGGWASYGEADGLAHRRCTSAACFGDQVWIGGMLGVSRLQDGKWTVFGKEVPGWSAYSMVAAPGGGVWVAGGSGLAFCSDDGTWAQHRVEHVEALPAGRASERWGRLAFDHAGALWVTNRWGAGMGLLREGKWQRLTASDGLPSNSNSAVACDAGGVVWAGFGGLYRLVDGKWERVALPAKLEGCGHVSALAPSTDGAVWAAVTSGSHPELGGVVRVEGEQTGIYTPATSPLPSARVRDVLVARNGDVWFASDTGAARVSPAGEWETVTSVNSGLCCNIVLALAEDSQGRIWFATADGVSCRE